MSREGRGVAPHPCHNAKVAVQILPDGGFLFARGLGGRSTVPALCIGAAAAAWRSAWEDPFRRHRPVPVWTITAACRLVWGWILILIGTILVALGLRLMLQGLT
jgi:hypothetical protein